MHVTELLGKQAPPFDPVNPFAFNAEQPLYAGMLDSLLDPEHQPPTSHRREPSRGAQLAKIAGLGVASFALCASIAVGSMITHQRRESGATEAAARPTVDITGEQALLPDQLNRAVPKAGMTGQLELAGTPTVATGSIDNSGPPPNPPGPPQTAPSTDTVRTDEQLSKTQLVERFFRLAAGAPDRAFSLLDGTLLGTDLGQFTRSWSGVRDVQVLDVREQGDGVLAVVRLRLPDGSYLRLQQLFDVANTPPRRIIGAEILSAQRN